MYLPAHWINTLEKWAEGKEMHRLHLTGWQVKNGCNIDFEWLIVRSESNRLVLVLWKQNLSSFCVVTFQVMVFFAEQELLYVLWKSAVLWGNMRAVLSICCSFTAVWFLPFAWYNISQHSSCNNLVINRPNILFSAFQMWRFSAFFSPLWQQTEYLWVVNKTSHLRRHLGFWATAINIFWTK